MTPKSQLRDPQLCEAQLSCVRLLCVPQFSHRLSGIRATLSLAGGGSEQTEEPPPCVLLRSSHWEWSNVVLIFFF